MQWKNARMWKTLLRLNRCIEIMHYMLTRPFERYAFRLVIHLPFSAFHFRPLFLNEVYMALGLWEPYVRKTLTLRRGDALVDVGAHIGYHTLYASRRVGTSGSVIAIEPDERNLALLRKNTGAAKASNVQILEAAAGLGNTLYLLPCENPLYTKTVGRIEAGDLGEVNSIPLDRLMASLSFGRHSNIFLKIDVEGSELDVIRGGLSFIKTYHPTIIVESWNHTLLQQTLAEAGYDCIRLFAFYYRCVPAEETPSSN